MFDFKVVKSEDLEELREKIPVDKEYIIYDTGIIIERALMSDGKLTIKLGGA